MKGLIIFLAVFTLIAAIPLEGKPKQEGSIEDVQFCATQTPCAWVIYKRNNPDLLDEIILNSFCKCAPGHNCEFYEKLQEETKMDIHKCN